MKKEEKIYKINKNKMYRIKKQTKYTTNVILTVSEKPE